MRTRCNDRALSRGPQGLSRAALILGGLLLLMVP
jgi:hypothetical protein